MQTPLAHIAKRVQHIVRGLAGWRETVEVVGPAACAGRREADRAVGPTPSWSERVGDGRKAPDQEIMVLLPAVRRSVQSVSQSVRASSDSRSTMSSMDEAER